MRYYSSPNSQSQHDFGQSDPRHFCPERHSPLFVGTDASGKPFRIRHRDPRCSLECFDAWAGQEHHCVVEFFKNLPADAKIYRGHLSLPAGATVADHATTRTRFMAALRVLKSRLRKKLPNLVLELRCYTHCTAPDAQHYDTIIYGNLPQDELRRCLKRPWINSGGRDDVVCVAVEPGEEITATGYLAKTQARYRTRHYLPASNKLDHVWGTTGFFGTTNKTKIWAGLRAKWHPPAPPTPLVSNTCVKPYHATNQSLTHQLNAAFDEVTGTEAYRDYIDRDLIRRVLKGTPAESIGINAIAHRSGTPVYRVEKLLPSVPGARTIKGWRDAQGGVCNGGWFKTDYVATDEEWQQLSDEAATLCDLIGTDHKHALRKLAQTEFFTTKGGA